MGRVFSRVTKACDCDAPSRGKGYHAERCAAYDGTKYDSISWDDLRVIYDRTFPDYPDDCQGGTCECEGFPDCATMAERLAAAVAEERERGDAIEQQLSHERAYYLGEIARLRLRLESIRLRAQTWGILG